MPTWHEVREHLRARYLLVADEPGWVGMEWPFRHGPTVVPQRVKVERVAALGTEWVLVLAAVCDADKIAALAALRFNARLVIGALVVEGERCYLRAVLPVDTLVLGDLERAIEVIAREAAGLREPGIPGERQAAPFTHYND